MITVSDNDAATSVFARVGPERLDAIAHRAGMHDFRSSTTWGASEISAADMAAMFADLGHLFGDRYEKFALGLLGSIVPEQSWGIPRIASARLERSFQGRLASRSRRADRQSGGGAAPGRHGGGDRGAHRSAAVDAIRHRDDRRNRVAPARRRLTPDAACTAAVPAGSLYVHRMSREASRILSLIVPLVAMLLILAPATGSAAKPKNDRHRVDLTGATKNVRQTAGGALIDRGTVSGKPFGKGKIKLVVHLHPEDQTATGTFRIRDHRGTAFGTIDTTFAIEGPEITFRGTADFTRWQGALQADPRQGPEGVRPQHARRPERHDRAEGLRHLLIAGRAPDRDPDRRLPGQASTRRRRRGRARRRATAGRGRSRPPSAAPSRPCARASSATRCASPRACSSSSRTVSTPARLRPCSAVISWIRRSRSTSSCE